LLSIAVFIWGNLQWSKGFSRPILICCICNISSTMPEVKSDDKVGDSAAEIPASTNEPTAKADYKEKETFSETPTRIFGSVASQSSGQEPSQQSVREPLTIFGANPLNNPFSDLNARFAARAFNARKSVGDKEEVGIPFPEVVTV
jgi:hypothetical protein